MTTYPDNIPLDDIATALRLMRAMQQTSIDKGRTTRAIAGTLPSGIPPVGPSTIPDVSPAPGSSSTVATGYYGPLAGPQAPPYSEYPGAGSSPGGTVTLPTQDETTAAGYNYPDPGQVPSNQYQGQPPSYAFNQGNLAPVGDQSYNPAVYSGQGTSASFGLPRDDPDYGNPNYIGLGNGPGAPAWLGTALRGGGQLAGSMTPLGPAGGILGKAAGNALYQIFDQGLSSGYNPNRAGVPANVPDFAGAGRAPWVVNPAPGRSVDFGGTAGGAFSPSRNATPGGVFSPSTMGVERPTYHAFGPGNGLNQSSGYYGNGISQGDQQLQQRIMNRSSEMGSADRDNFKPRPEPNQPAPFFMLQPPWTPPPPRG